MSRCLIQDEAIDVPAWRARLEDAGCGAAVFFEGRVRNHNQGRAVARLEYEAHPPLAVAVGEEVIAEALQRWPVVDAFCVHRYGVLELGEVAVLVGVASAHRDAAFEAARYIIDEAKQRLPIWKKEHYPEGDSGWVSASVGAAPRRDPGATER